MHNAISRREQFAIFEQMAEVDRREFDLDHRACFPYAGGVPCTIRGFGLFVKIKGQAFDCPGESQALGNVREEPLGTIWEKARLIQQSFDGGCLPRKLFWEKMGQTSNATETLV